MFYLLIIAATFGYALQTVLMATVYRRMDSLSAISYRGLSLGISMSPLLFFTEMESPFALLPYLPMIVGAAGLASVGNWFAANAYRKLPVGIANALCMGFAAIVVATIGVVFLGEHLSSSELTWGGLVLLSVFLLGTSKSPTHASIEYDVLGGVRDCVGFGLFLGCAFTIIGIVSREMDPLAAGYFWEMSIGACGVVIAMLRGRMGGKGFELINFSTFKKILLFSAPTAVGTGCFTVAVTLGPMGVATAILSTMMVASTLLSRIIFKEKLSYLQWGLLFVCYGMVVGLKLSGTS